MKIVYVFINFSVILLIDFNKFCATTSVILQPNNTTLAFDSYTEEELVKLPKFRARIKDGLTQPYMFENKYLVRFLRFKNLDLDAAVVAMRENFHWRKKFNVDSTDILAYSKFKRELPCHMTLDSQGRPVLLISLMNLNIRQIVLSGNIDKLRNYMFGVIERTIANFHLISNRTGREMIEGHTLINLAGFNLRTQACTACIPVWIELVDSYERYYPRFTYKIIAINSPRIFQRIFGIVKPFFSGHTFSRLTLYSVDKTQWIPELAKYFSKNRLPTEFGGNSKETYSILLPSDELVEKLLDGPQKLQ